MDLSKEKEKILVLSDGVWSWLDAEKYRLCKRLKPEDWLLAMDNLTPHKYDIAIQCIARQEERYFKEWIEHHLRLGIERIFVYDNNDEEGLEAFLKGVLSEEDFQRVEVIPWREKMKMQQIAAAEDCIQRHRHDVKWLLSIDLDEFLVLDMPLKDFLEGVSDASQVYFSWESIGADGQLHYEDKPLMERFKKPFDCKDAGQGKVMFRPERVEGFGIHAVSLKKGKTVNVLNEEIVAPDSYRNVHQKAWVKHFFTKSLEEWEQKISRGCADNLYCRRYNTFFEVNPDLRAYYNPNAAKIQKHSHAPDGEIPMV